MALLNMGRHLGGHNKALVNQRLEFTTCFSRQADGSAAEAGGLAACPVDVFRIPRRRDGNQDIPRLSKPLNLTLKNAVIAIVIGDGR